MCLPAATAGAAATASTLTQLQVVGAVGQSLLSIKNQAMNAKMQKKAQQVGMENERKRFNQQMTAQRIQEAQEAIAAGQDIQRIARATEQAKARAITSAGEAGVTGTAIDQLISDFTRQEAVASFAIQKQQEFKGVGYWLQEQDAISASQQRLASLNQPVEPINYAGELMNLAQTGLSIYKGVKQDKLMDAQLNYYNTKGEAGTVSGALNNATNAYNEANTNYGYEVDAYNSAANKLSEARQNTSSAQNSRNRAQLTGDKDQ